MSPDTIERLLAWLEGGEPAAARTILNAALSAATPRKMAERYLIQYRSVLASVSHLEPHLARTMASLTFMAAHPVETAKHHLARIGELERVFCTSAAPLRTLAREACRSPRPERAGQRFVDDPRAVVRQLTNRGTHVTIARSIAGVACLHADPREKAEQMLEHFSAALEVAKETCPTAARSIALAACRSPEPVNAARHFADVYNGILQMVGRRNPRLTNHVGAQAFRCDRPFLAARRYLRQRQGNDPGGTTRSRDGARPDLLSSS